MWSCCSLHGLPASKSYTIYTITPTACLFCCSSGSKMCNKSGVVPHLDPSSRIKKTGNLQCIKLPTCDTFYCCRINACCTSCECLTSISPENCYIVCVGREHNGCKWEVSCILFYIQQIWSGSVFAGINYPEAMKFNTIIYKGIGRSDVKPCVWRSPFWPLL